MDPRTCGPVGCEQNIYPVCSKKYGPVELQGAISLISATKNKPGKASKTAVHRQARLLCSKLKAWSPLIKMADDELAAIRAKRMEELQSQYGVCSFDILAFLLSFV